MEAIFLKLLNMSITASYLVVAVVLLRLVLKKAPRIISLILWALVGIRLILPISFESIFSLIPSAQTFPSDFSTSLTPSINSGIPTLDSNINQIIPQAPIPSNPGGTQILNPGTDTIISQTPSTSASPLETIIFIATIVWAAGVAAMLLYGLITYIRLRLKVREAVKTEGNVMVCDHIASPFILGLFRPRIYIPSSTDVKDVYYVLAHENAHLKRRDHFWKPLGFFLLSVYWFNPVMWAAYILLCRDIELACDEKVIKELGTEAKKPYSTALVNCSVSHKVIAVCPLAFGEVGVKRRVKTVLNYKKPAFWIIIIAIIACVAVTICFLTNPPNNNDTTTTTNQDTITTTTPDNNQTTDPTQNPSNDEKLVYQKVYRTQSGTTNTVTICVYNDKNQLIKETTYDESGNLTTEQRCNYDENGTKIYHAISLENRYFEETKYDKHGNVTSFIIHGADGSTSSTSRFRYEYEYDNTGNLVAETCYGIYGENEFLVHEKEYNKNGKIVRAHHYEDMETIIQYQYDANGNLTLELSNYPDGSLDCKYEYEYDKNGNLLSKTYYLELNGALWKDICEYDSYGNCTLEARYDGNGKAVEIIESIYTYDANGNIKAKTGYRNGTVLYQLTYSDFYYPNVSNRGVVTTDLDHDGVDETITLYYTQEISNTTNSTITSYLTINIEDSNNSELSISLNLNDDKFVSDDTIIEKDEHGDVLIKIPDNDQFAYQVLYFENGYAISQAVK